jgi:tRNA G26 N,N-dimethylase Trm1
MDMPVYDIRAAPPHPEGFELLTEGKATVLHPKGQVFYNPIQQFNRDMSILTIKHFIKKLGTGQKTYSKIAFKNLTKISRKICFKKTSKSQRN